MIENPNLLKKINPKESKLKTIIVEYVGESLNPEKDEITTQQIIEVFADEFPEFLLSIAEENWINGYTHALKDLQFVDSQKKQNDKD